MASIYLLSYRPDSQKKPASFGSSMAATSTPFNLSKTFSPPAASYSHSLSRCSDPVVHKLDPTMQGETQGKKEAEAGAATEDLQQQPGGKGRQSLVTGYQSMLQRQFHPRQMSHHHRISSAPPTSHLTTTPLTDAGTNLLSSRRLPSAGPPASFPAPCALHEDPTTKAAPPSFSPDPSSAATPNTHLFTNTPFNSQVAAQGLHRELHGEAFYPITEGQPAPPAPPLPPEGNSSGTAYRNALGPATSRLDTPPPRFQQSQQQQQQQQQQPCPLCSHSTCPCCGACVGIGAKEIQQRHVQYLGNPLLTAHSRLHPDGLLRRMGGECQEEQPHPGLDRSTHRQVSAFLGFGLQSS